MSKKKIVLRIDMGDDRQLNLGADNMNELVDKIIEWQDWDTNKNYLPKKDTTPAKEKACGWYYFKDKK